MALFKKRKGADDPVAPSTPAESIEAMRRRARHRLIGAVVLVLAAVVGFPILFDTQPRPVAVDIPIEIPDRNKVKPLAPPAPAPAVAAAGKVTPESEVITETREPEAASTPVTQPATPAAPARAAASQPKPAAADKPAKAEAAVAEKKPEPKPAAEDAAKARALLEGKSVDTAATGERFVVQVGAFAETEKAKLAQQKLQRAGLRNYTNVAETKDGKRIRVRAGPFASRAEASEAAEKIKGLDLPAAILTL